MKTTINDIICSQVPSALLDSELLAELNGAVAYIARAVEPMGETDELPGDYLDPPTMERRLESGALALAGVTSPRRIQS